MKLEALNPPALGKAVGYSNGILAPAGARLLFVAGQVGWDEKHAFPEDGEGAFLAQFERALANLLVVVKEAGGGPESIARLTIYVTDKKRYVERTREIGKVWREKLGKWYPAMTLVQVSALLEDKALLELEATCVLDGAKP